MRSITLFFIGLLFISNVATAQKAKYEKAMEKAVATIQEASNAEAFINAGNVFERIAKAESDQWLPLYYQSYANMMAAVQYLQEQKMNDCIAHVKKAEEQIKMAKEIAPKESEIFALYGLILQGYIWEDPQTKGAEYTPMVMQAAETAIALDPQNPRGFYIKAQQLFYMPSFYGGGPEAAKPFLEKAMEKFNSFKPSSSIHPNWGKGNVEQLLAQAEK